MVINDPFICEIKTREIVDTLMRDCKVPSRYCLYVIWCASNAYRCGEEIMRILCFKPWKRS